MQPGFNLRLAGFDLAGVIVADSSPRPKSDQSSLGLLAIARFERRLQ